MSLNISFFSAIVLSLFASISFLTASSLPSFSKFLIIVLCILSYIAGTKEANVILYSFRFSTICLIPSQNDLCAPIYSEYNIPTVHSKTWCNGKNDNILSLESISNTEAKSITFDTIFLWESATTFDFDVVPEVNNIILISSGFIFASIKLLSPASTNSFPFSINSFCEYIPSLCISESIEIKCFNLFFSLYLIFSTISSYFLE